jgi:phosphoribosylaminoimidazolecarboxamide formyltransferase / IMP cyclohydrolase
MSNVKVERALISVSDKTGVVELARGLVELGVEIISSGGTAAALAEAGVPVRKVTEITAAPEILGGRVKTLHPKIHGGILADRRKPGHIAELEEQGIEPIDLVVCNLYPFEKTVADPNVTEDEAVEEIDIGGPAMVRAAAKNFDSVVVVVRPDRYQDVVTEIGESGTVSEDTRRELALEAFSHTASYDLAISHYLEGRGAGAAPQELVLRFEKAMDLRYGENPHQTAAFYRDADVISGLAAATQYHGKELSYNNLLDTDAAWKLVLELEAPAAAIIKHSNPCGVAQADSLSDAYRRALDCDTTSAFGGIVALNETCDLSTAEQIAQIFTEVVIAPAFSSDALDLLQQKKNLRILAGSTETPSEPELRRVAGGVLVQSRDERDSAHDARVVTKVQPTEDQWRDLRFAWIVAKHVKSNAIVLAKDQTALGIGAGQMSRVEATELAARRAEERAKDTACASDAFFPFRDGLDAAVAAGASAVIQPGGSVRDEEVIAAADDHGIPMVFTGRRHFRH